MNTRCLTDNTAVNQNHSIAVPEFETGGLAVYDVDSLVRAVRVIEDIGWQRQQEAVDNFNQTTLRLVNDLDFFAGQAVDDDLKGALWAICWAADISTSELKEAMALVKERVRAAVDEYLTACATEPGSPLSIAAGWDR